MNYLCCTEKRRNAVRRRPGLNGIDYLEVQAVGTSASSEQESVLYLHFLKPLAEDSLSRQNILIRGGEGVKVMPVVEAIRMSEAVPSGADNVLQVKVAGVGDFSTYALYLVRDSEKADNLAPPEAYDRLLSRVEFSFRVNQANAADCQPAPIQSVKTFESPQINYLAKDYASFRQLILDRIALLSPGWTERNPADLGMALVELLAYTADYLSYRQDAIATEAYLGTARKRISVRRHARLVDYEMHDGCNARAWIHLKVSPGDEKVILRKGNGEHTTKVLTTTEGLPPAFRLDSSAFAEALNAGAQVFELMHDAILYEQHNEIFFYTWGEEDCRLQKGATEAALLDADPEKPLHLQIGDLLVFAERQDPETGAFQDAAATRRHVVRLTSVVKTKDIDVAYYASLSESSSEDSPPENRSVSIVAVKWDAADALPFSLCISRKGRDNISLALGNIVLADHGLTILDRGNNSLLPSSVPAPRLTYAQSDNSRACRESAAKAIPPRFYPRLLRGPLTYASPLAVFMEKGEDGQAPLSKLAGQSERKQIQTAAALMRWSVREALPAIRLWEAADESAQWLPRRDLLIDSAASDRHFVVEVETDGSAFLRFGDNKNGLRPNVGATFRAQYRLGNGRAGNVGANTLTHIATNDADLIARLPIGASAVWNPLPAQGGKEGETIEEVKQYAPQAFRTQQRAVTPADYEAFAKECKSDVQRAAATFRWTGSWRTAFVTVDRLGGLAVNAAYEKELRQCLEQYRMAGFDLQVDAPIYVPLDIEMIVQVQSSFFAADVRQALLAVFGNRVLADGRRGVFHPDNLSFGQPVYLSRIYAAAQKVEGVDSVQITKFQRWENPDEEAMESGKLLFGRREIARLDNDPNFPNRGSFNLIMKGGR